MEIQQAKDRLQDICLGFEIIASYVLIITLIAAIWGKVSWFLPVGIFLAMLVGFVYFIKSCRENH